MDRLPAVIFDFGNVLAFFDYARAGEALGRQIGLSGEAFMSKIREAGFPPLLREYESGRIGTDEFAREVGRMAGIAASAEEFASAWSDIFTINEPAARLAAEIKRRGHRLVLGSNTNALHAGHFQRRFADWLGPFEDRVLSHEVGHLKPSAEFYLACARAARADPGDCVFIDDLAENVEGAGSAGLRGIVFRDVPSLIEDLRGMGVIVDVG